MWYFYRRKKTLEHEDNHFKPAKGTRRDSLIECAGELKCDNLVIVTNNDEHTIEKDGIKIDVIPISKF